MSSSKIASDERSGAIERIGGLEIAQASAVATGVSSGSISKRTSGSVPHHPASLGTSLPRWRSWTKAAAVDPGPPFRYL